MARNELASEALQPGPLADTAIRRWHYGPYPYGWEDARAEPVRCRTYNYRLRDC